MTLAADRRADGVPGMRVLSFPDADHPYFRLFYEALQPYGVRVAYIGRVDDAMLEGAGRNFDAIHFHWGIEKIWRWRRARSPVWVAIGLAGWQQFLRQARRAGVRIIWTAHELGPPRGDGGTWLDRLGYAMCARAADLCICHARCCQDVLVRSYRVDPTRILVIPHGTFYGIFPPPQRRAATLNSFGIPLDRRVLLCFGDLRPRKGIAIAIAAADALGPPYHLIVAGSAPNDQALRWLRSIPEMARNVPHVTLHLERLSDQELADLIHAADCVLLPYTDIFVSGALAACLALGRAVVASDLPYFREVLANEPDAGVLAAAGSPQALVSSVEQFFRLPLEQRNTAAGRLGDRLAWPKIIRPLATHLTRLLG
jgi:beta-1,4-mannosyltransferase